MVSNQTKTAQDKFRMCGYGKYFTLNINQRINERQHRNSLNINNLFATVLRQSIYKDSEHPKINNGLYHHIGKNHSQYPKK